VASLLDAFVLADCRLTYRSNSGAVYRDGCQKMVVANAWSVVAFAGDLCLGRHLLNGVVSRLRETPFDDARWLADDSELLRFVEAGMTNHLLLGPEHIDCRRYSAALMIVWMDHSTRVSPDGANMFPPVSQIVVVGTPELSCRRKHRGLDVIGSGSIVAQPMQKEAFDMLVDFGRYHGDPETSPAHRALLATQVVRDLLHDAGGDPGVGGLYQVVTLDSHSVTSVPYFYLADVEPGFRTYVAMRPIGGEFVQEHRPTGTQVAIASPFALNPFAEFGTHEMFEPATALTRLSRGVVPAQSGEVVFSLYDPDNVPDSIRASWGSDPLEPATWSPIEIPTVTSPSSRRHVDVSGEAGKGPNGNESNGH
jgi:hypothetical protein